MALKNDAGIVASALAWGLALHQRVSGYPALVALGPKVRAMDAPGVKYVTQSDVRCAVPWPPERRQCYKVRRVSVASAKIRTVAIERAGQGVWRACVKQLRRI